MYKKRIHVAAFAAASLMALGVMAGPALGQSAKTPKKDLDPSAVLTWSPAQQRERYKDMEDYFPVATIKKGDHVSPLPAGPAIDPKVTFQGKTYTVDRIHGEVPHLRPDGGEGRQGGDGEVRPGPHAS